MSTLLQELYTVLHIRRIRTTPYHPQTDGLVERFNGTLKSMLRKFVGRSGKDWDEYLPYLLFAYREVPQESTGVSPFEMLYGRRVRGPLDVIREGWTGEGSDGGIYTPQVLEMRDRLEQMREVVNERALKAQERQKEYYNRKTVRRTLSVGDEVLVLLPNKHNSLKLEWMGPYKVKRQVGEVDYEIEMAGRKKDTRVYHVNLLKKWCPPVHVCYAQEGEYQTLEEEESGQDIQFYDQEVAVIGEQGQHLGERKRMLLLELLRKFSELFRRIPGRTDVVEHSIHTGDHHPIRQKPYRVPYSKREVLQEEIQKMLDCGVIRQSSSPWAAPIVLVDKKGGGVRFCVDYRKLNSVATFDSYPMPRVEELFETVGSAKVMTTLDLAKGYWQIPLDATSKEKTAFATPDGLYEFEVMPFGLHSAPATFQRMVNTVLRSCFPFARAYIDDIVIFSQSYQDHLFHLEAVLSCLKNANLTVQLGKCQFAKPYVHYLGHVIGQGKVFPDREKIDAVIRYPQPETKKEIRAFLGLVGYYRRFIPQFATLAVPLTNLTKKKEPDKIRWSDECDVAFQALKECLSKEPILQVADPKKLFVLQTDASDLGIGAVLNQKGEDQEEHPVAYASRRLLPREVRYSTVEKECLAIVWALKYFRTYLLGQEFIIETDHKPLSWLHRMKDNNSRLMRWVIQIQSYKFELRYRKGKHNANADGLSRAGRDIRMMSDSAGPDPPPSS